MNEGNVSNFSDNILIKKNIFIIFLCGYIVLGFLVPTEADILKLFLIVGLFTSGLMLKKRIHKSLFFLGFTVLAYNLFLALFGFLKWGKYAIPDIKVLVIYQLFYCLLVLLINKKEYLIKLHNTVQLSAFLVSLYFFYTLLGTLNIIPFYLGDFLKQEFSLSYGTGFIKIYGSNSLNYVFFTPYLYFTILLSPKNDKFKIMKIINFILALLATIVILRRGIILGIVISTFIVMIFINESKIILLKKIILIILFLFLVILIILFLFGDIIKLENYIAEIMSTFNFTTNRSNLARVEAAKKLFEGWTLNPVFGNGFGAHFSDYERSSVNVANFELQYMKTLFTSGLVGIFLYGFSYLYIFIKSVKLSLTYPFYKTYLVPALAGQLSVIIANASNPILSQLCAFLMFYYAIFVLNIGLLNKDVR